MDDVGGSREDEVVEQVAAGVHGLCADAARAAGLIDGILDLDRVADLASVLPDPG
ncbi:hypothetical protein [Streptomyces winkii]|uniref:hypothetical protein n=1 Tax=Streptomyces winkii TaxID=3051178 RepID=UPI0028D7B472|nr:hypothetical protein [Streptomyces sp. DSM 40971]